jgi:hypothetical protein
MSFLVVLLLGCSLLMCQFARTLVAFSQSHAIGKIRPSWELYILNIIVPNLWVGTFVLASGGIYIFRRQDRAGILLQWLLGLSLAFVIMSAELLYFMLDLIGWGLRSWSTM